jgi:trk system potassium uptake protein TrkA
VVFSDKSFAVIGLSKFGYRVATGLFAAGAEVIALDRDEHLIQKIADHVTRAARADAMDEEALEHLGIFDVDVVIIGFRSSFDTAVLLTMTLRKKNADIHIITQVDTDEKEEAVKRVGGNVTVFPERDIADRLVRRLATPDLVEHMELAPDVAVVEMGVPENFVGQSLADLGIRAKFNVHVIGVVSPTGSSRSKNVLIAPSADTLFSEGDTLLVLGKIENLNRFSAANPS